MTNIDDMVGRLASVHDHELAGAAFGEEADALLSSLRSQDPATSRHPRRLWRLRLALGATATAAIVAGAIVAGPGLFDEPPAAYANSAIDIRREHDWGRDWWVARIKDGHAKPEKFHEAFRAVGLDVTVRKVPASPSYVGLVINVLDSKTGVSPGFHPGAIIDATTQCQPGGVCTVRIAGDPGPVLFEFGREAKPGESYANSISDIATNKGEALEGLDLRDGMPVKTVLAEVDRRGLRAQFTFMKFVDGISGHWPKAISPDRVRPDWWVYTAYPVKPGVVRLAVSPKRLPAYQNPNGEPCPEDNPNC